jgi:AhpD family alkylhydroperoxidase
MKDPQFTFVVKRLIGGRGAGSVSNFERGSQNRHRSLHGCKSRLHEFALLPLFQTRALNFGLGTNRRPPLPDTVLEICRRNFTEIPMATFGLVEYKDASPEVRVVYDDIMATRKTDWINNFWKAIAHDPALLKRTWESIKQIMAPGALDPLTKEMIYVAVSVTNNCQYCIASHTASAFGKGMTDGMFKELQAVIGMANETNKLVTGYQVEIDERFKPPLQR